MVNAAERNTPIVRLIYKDNRNFDLLKHKLGTLRVTRFRENGLLKYPSRVPALKKAREFMGGDFGLKVPAVAASVF